MRPYKYYYLLFICLLATTNAYSQFLNYGTDPLRYKWNQVKLPHYRIIYPNGLDSLAYRYAIYLENLYVPVSRTTGLRKAPVFPVVLHPGNMVANGMVVWAPRRMELLTTPSLKMHAESWEQHLTVHESRHVFQTYRMTNGWFKPLYYIIGEQSAGVGAAFVPKWFFEGDAVVAETALTEAGRGRLPEFQMIYRTQMLTDKFYSFDKWHFGSYRDYTGTFYTLGYDLVSFARYKYGADIWDKTMTRYVRHPISFPTFSNAFKKNTGKNFNRLFRETFEFLRNDWAALDSGYTTPTFLSPERKRHYTSYQYPKQLNDSTVIALKSSLNDIASIVSITNGRERRLAYTGSINGQITLHRNRVYWTENVQSLRWSQEIYSTIKYLDLSTGKVGTLNSQLKRVVNIATEGNTMAASTFTEDGKSILLLLDLDNYGQEIASFTSPESSFIKETVFGDELLYAITTGDKGISIQSLDTADGKWRRILDYTRANITGLTWGNNGKLYFESGLEGVNNIYCIDENGTSYRLTSSRFGAFQPALKKDNSLIFAEYQPKGYRIATLSNDSLEWRKADFANPYHYTMAENMAEQEGYNINTETMQSVDFVPQSYRKLSHLFNIHSWTPVYYNVREVVNSNADNFLTEIKPGASIISQNTLNTAVTQAGWYYDGYHHAALNFSYTGLLPVINLNLDYGGKTHDILWKKNEEDKIVLSSIMTKRTNLNLEAQAYIPFNLSNNQHIRGIRPTLTYNASGDRYEQYPSRRMPYYQHLLSEIYIYNYRRMATQEILPRWGFQLRLQQLTMPFNPHTAGDLYAARLTTYLPGIVRTHSLMLRFGYQYQNLDGKMFYAFKQLLEEPRGLNYNYSAQHHTTFKADYALPLIMPDLSISSLAYIRRIRANLFYDLSIAQNYKSNSWSKQNSTGVDILFEWNALRFYFPLTTGVRLINTLGNSPVRAQIISSISF